MASPFSPFCGRDCPLFSLILFFLLWCVFPLSSHGQITPAVYTFGDSLADVGNNNHLHLSLLKANFPHNGVDYPGRKATGRFGNGRNSADFLAEKLGLQTSPPYLSISSSGGPDAFLKGVSFASGGAGVLNSTNKDHCLTLDKQIEYFSRVHAALQQKLGDVETKKHISQSIFIVVIGSNDLLGYFKSDPSERAKSTPQHLVDTLIFKLKGQLKNIYDLGARRIAFIGTGPIGCCPSERARTNKGDCNVESNYGSMKFNEGVSSVLGEMKAELGDFSYSFFDTYAALMEIIESPSSYGFTEVKAACCGLGNLNAKVACLPIATYCSNREEYVFWDFYHPTEASFRRLTETVFNGSRPLVHPLNVRQLASLKV
ncbi:unnamed protein product [Spirodela intermedia]|uniref:Uncharacterized protein n=1 Tax=Spirodela intermedia TaxID=51605 RepID=A0A7I8KDW4_SPIIN|nr:unnamed protein product [Spirodela intermedia]